MLSFEDFSSAVKKEDPPKFDTIVRVLILFCHTSLKTDVKDLTKLSLLYYVVNSINSDGNAFLFIFCSKAF